MAEQPRRCEFWGHEAVAATVVGPLRGVPSVMTYACDKCAKHLVRADTTRVDESGPESTTASGRVGPEGSVSLEHETEQS